MTRTNLTIALGGALALAACGSERDFPSQPSTLPAADQTFIEQTIEELDPPISQGPLTITQGGLVGNTVLFRATAAAELQLSSDEQSQCAFRASMCSEPSMREFIDRADELRFDYYDSAGAFAFGMSVRDCEPLAASEPEAEGDAAAEGEPAAEGELANETEPEAEGRQCAIISDQPLGG
ncbi:MAG: hypothetical protein H7X93_02585 [Sphingomonadaceae bacterium]|nr:hypothetical protein [Sphingomonadaceae bacterium]